MNSHGFEVIKFSELHNDENRRVVRLVNFFRRDDVFNGILEQAVVSNRITVPSIYSDGWASCTKGGFLGQNYLLFKDGVDCFAISQLSSLLYSVIDFKNKIFYSQERNYGRQDSLINKFLEKIDLKNISGEGFLGIINGYQRPYHYFYDKIPFIFLLDFSLVSKSKFLSVRDKAFLPASFFGELNEEVVDDLPEYLDINNGFAIDLGHPYQFSSKEYLNSILDDKVRDFYLSNKHDKCQDSVGGPVIWIGCCQEKRQWVELLDSLCLFIGKIRVEFPEALFVFDGLTRPEFMDEYKFKRIKRVEKDICGINKIVQSVGGVNKLVLAGCTAKEKLEWAFKADFFISNALTDSMWCSRFAMKHGVCFSSKASQSEVFQQHRHPNATIFPFDRVRDLGHKDENWSKMSFSIDPREFSEFAFAKFKESCFSEVSNDT